ncbi:autotransporter outer membrane beta-barrel domain-containing protein [Acidocella sp.]|uniref:autotransporter outer membrane beta-barrel domain-containing protein n=1 Tax=Acidocella sp. TaxID=50710 RepID=UPI00262C3ABB|nr:autotransporter outer membrane beta-barrel domain-containing protein [Acidocella sp.]
MSSLHDGQRTALGAAGASLLVLPAALGLAAPAPTQAQTVISTNQTTPIDLSLFGAAGVSIAPGVTLSAPGAVDLWDLAAAQVSNQGVIEAPLGVGVSLAGGGVVSNAGTITGNSAVLLGAGGTFENSGSVAAALYGVRVRGGAGLVNNGGTLAAGFIGVALEAGGSVANGGAISGGALGVYGAGAAVSLSNAGTIGGGTGDGVSLLKGGVVENLAGGVIEGGYAGLYGGAAMSLSNAGLISGTQYGALLNGGAVSLSNSGTLSGGLVGAMALANGATLDNVSGLVSGGGIGARVAGTGSMIANGGHIAGGQIGARLGRGDGLANGGVITGGRYGVEAVSGDVITNSGTIAGLDGILAGGPVSIVDTGLIAGQSGGVAVGFLNGASTLALGTGALIEGGVDGGGTASQIVLSGTGLLNTPLSQFGAGSALTVMPGAAWTGAGAWTIGALVNNGTFTPGLVSAPLTLNGNFVQGAAGVLKVYVAPNGIAAFNISGSATLTGTLDYMLAPGTYEPGSETFLTAQGGVSGAFTSVNALNDPTAGAQISGASLPGPGGASLRLGGALTVAPTGTGLISDIAMAQALGAGAADDILLTQAETPEATPCPVAPAPGTGTAAGVAAALARGMCLAGGWVQAEGGAMTVDGAFSAAGGGFMAGVDRPVGAAGLRLGLAVGYEARALWATGAGSATLGGLRLGTYASLPVGAVRLSGDVMESFTTLQTSRDTGAGPASGRAHGNVTSLGLRARVPLEMGGWGITPALGLDVVDVTMGRLDEMAAQQAFAVVVRGSNGVAVMPYGQVALTRRFVLGNGLAVVPSALLGVRGVTGDVGHGLRVSAQDGTMFGAAAPEMSPVAGEAALGVRIGRGAWALSARATAELAGNWHAESLAGGLVVNF